MKANLDWMTGAVCAQIDPELFFPTKGSGRGVTKRAKQMCAGCPVKRECLDYSQATGEDQFGVWAALSEKQRRALLSAEPVTESQ